jgi:hypothetical protein
MRIHCVIAVPMDYTVLFWFVSGAKRTIVSDGLLIVVTATVNVNVPFTVLDLVVFSDRLGFALLFKRFQRTNHSFVLGASSRGRL